MVTARRGFGVAKKRENPIQTDFIFEEMLSTTDFFSDFTRVLP
jgi:hypothetical protein